MRSKPTRRPLIVAGLLILLALAVLALLPLLLNGSMLKVSDADRIRYGVSVAENIAELIEQPMNSFRMPAGMVYIWEVRDRGLIRMECDNDDKVTSVSVGRRLTWFESYLNRLRRMLGI